MSDQEKDDSYTLTDEETNNEFTSVENSTPSKSHCSEETLKIDKKEKTMELIQEKQSFTGNDHLTTPPIQPTTNTFNEPEKKINDQTKKKNQSHHQEKSFTNKNDNHKTNGIKDIFNQKNTKEQSDYSSSIELLQPPVAFPKKDDKIKIGRSKSEKERKSLQKDLSSTTTFPKQRNQKETIGLLQPPLPIQTTGPTQKSNSSQKRTFQHIVRDIIKERESCRTSSSIECETTRDVPRDISREQQRMPLNQNLNHYKREEILNVYPQQPLQPSAPKRMSTFNTSFPSVVQQPEMFYRQEPLQINRTIQQPQIGQPISFNQNIFEVYEKYFMMFGAFVECWPDDAFTQYSKQVVKKIVKDYIMKPELFQTCPLHIRNQIYSYTALKYVLNQVRKGSYELPFELELMYKDGWERSCDVCLLKEMERCGLCYFEGYVQNDCINYVLTQVMKLSQEQKISFIQQRCSFLLRCIILKR
ncbi:Hypothetical protein EHI5A_048550 [Entamoeba histolytica KU27]|uniref:Uncharacterized protein n=1 Tax=Entamoeba histolytica KU27 TaxID=885311 RepID=M2SDH1_ENTHI|nr:Hypothetical protein EHI5A_048550 [Entamoeba histolytica KU27]